MRRHGHQPQHAGAARPTPPTGGSGVMPPSAPRLDPEGLAAIVDFARQLGDLAAPRREGLRQAANQLRAVPELQAEVARLRTELAAAYARAPHLARPATHDADLPAVGSFGA